MRGRPVEIKPKPGEAENLVFRDIQLPAVLSLVGRRALNFNVNSRHQSVK